MITVTKLNFKQLLSQLADGNRSGCLDFNGGEVSWKIYLEQGKIQYIYCSVQLLEQLKHRLHDLGVKETVAALKNLPQSLLANSSDSSDLYRKIIPWLLAEKHLSSSDSHKLITNVIKDELQSCLWLEQGSYSWSEGDLTPTWIKTQFYNPIALNISECLQEAQIKLQQWQTCSQKIFSIDQRPYFLPDWESKNIPTSGSLNNLALTKLNQVLKGQTSIRQLSILLNKNVLHVGKILSPYLDAKIIDLHPAQTPLDKLPFIPRSSNNSSNKLVDNSSAAVNTWKIVCIDDSPTILNEIKRFLDPNKFIVTAIDDPIKAVSQIFTINPDLILLDITMPRINGYKLCGLLRNSGKCDETPIIMVSGNTGLIDKAKAKLSGATDYFTKPFTKEGLNQIIAMHLK